MSEPKLSDLDRHWLEQELARYCYKPGWDLRISPHAPALTITARLPDSRAGRHDQIIKVASMAVIPPYAVSEDAFAGWLRHAMHEREAHEADEWLRRDGAVLFDPHAKR